jgi:hypothetical protein
VDPRAGLNAVAKRKIPCLCRETNSGRPDRSLVTILTELLRFSLKLSGYRVCPFTQRNTTCGSTYSIMSRVTETVDYRSQPRKISSQGTAYKL